MNDQQQKSDWTAEYLFKPWGMIILLMCGSGLISAIHPNIHLSLDNIKIGFQLFSKESYGYYTMWCAMMAFIFSSLLFYLGTPDSKWENFFKSIKAQLFSLIVGMFWFLILLMILQLSDWIKMAFPWQLLVVSALAALMDGLLIYLNKKISSVGKFVGVGLFFAIVIVAPFYLPFFKS
ncbi:hypothetical protein [Vibrio spartinae]|uniref:Uncharacterized protein n=1 Tax=Vibrio spartinae TaxID=1918945 RepID=A0A1N6MBF6_9VIBR|nr:hypothetical protein [Vibrio spartinae]SIO96753.1 hypothetical protein VSP9026_04567 [Vibrio spartinae]